MALTNAEKQKRFRERQKLRAAGLLAIPVKSEIYSPPPPIAAKTSRLMDLIAKAQELAAEINQEILADLMAKPVTLQTCRQIAAIGDANQRITLAATNVPV